MNHYPSSSKTTGEELSPPADGSAVLLTGATGLVGRYVLAELLRKRVPTVVLVREFRSGSASDRVDDALRSLEQHSWLARPIAVTADLTRLQPEHVQSLKSLPFKSWRVIHSAASIRFNLDEHTGEPYRTNLDGTRSLLEFCQQLPIQSFHHVSTAYAQRRKAGTSSKLMETSVDSSVAPGNDYEKSKRQAEELVLSSSWLPSISVYRPSIVVGDSRTSFTSTFHGFYAPLQMASKLAQAFGVSDAAGDALRSSLGVQANDCKNFVPVDWVAKAIVELFLNRESHGRTFHLTHPKPVSTEVIQQVIADALREKYPVAKNDLRSLLLDNAASFREQLDAYASYFSNDPEFDRSNTERFLSDLPVPDLGYDQLLSLARFAISNNFGMPSKKPANAAVRSTAETLTDALRNGSHSKASHSKAQSRSSNIDVAPRRSQRVAIEVSLYGPSQTLRNCRQLQRYVRDGGTWSAVSEVKSSETICFAIQITGAALDTCATQTIDPIGLVHSGQLAIQGDPPENWVAIVSDWIQSVSVGAG